MRLILQTRVELPPMFFWNKHMLSLLEETFKYFLKFFIERSLLLDLFNRRSGKQNVSWYLKTR